MNSIECLQDKSDYKDHWDLLYYRIDGYCRDKVRQTLSRQYVQRAYSVTWLLNGKRRRKISCLEKNFTKQKRNNNLSHLMCPDDNDFSCTLFVAEIRNYGDLIHWKKLAWIKQKNGMLKKWARQCKLNELNFSKQDYLKMLKTCRQRIQVDKLRINEHTKEWNSKNTNV